MPLRADRGALDRLLPAGVTVAVSLLAALPLHADPLPEPAAPSGELAAAGDTLRGAISGPPGTPVKGVQAGGDSPRGVSHLFHLGAKQFYLDKEKPLALTEDQSMQLRRLWEFDQEERLRFLDARTRREREIYRLTGEDRIRLPEIERAVRDLERLRAERRLSFIRRVQEAASVLTEHQREMLRASMEAR